MVQVALELQSLRKLLTDSTQQSETATVAPHLKSNFASYSSLDLLFLIFLRPDPALTLAHS